MLIPLQITSSDLAITEAIEAKIRQKVDKLEKLYSHINSCRVTIKIPNKHHHKGKIFNVRLDITVPGKEIAATKESQEDLYAALRDAFDAAKRQLEDYARLQRGDIKHHENKPPPEKEPPSE
jgi:ribosomal subunit interface protein